MTISLSVSSRRFVVVLFNVYDCSLITLLDPTGLEVYTREAQRLGLLCPLVCREIGQDFADFDLGAEFVSHNSMHGLCGG